MNVPLDKRTSKLVKAKGSTGLLDISSLPQITRNVSETQLLALKSAGTKALSNMSEQFSKLNKLVKSDKSAKKHDEKKATFTVGNYDLAGKSTRDCDNYSTGSSGGSSPVPHEFTGIVDKNAQYYDRADLAIDGLNLISPGDKPAPEITIQSAAEGEREEKERAMPPTTLNLAKNISHSSSEVDGNVNPGNYIQVEASGEKKRSSSEQDLTINNITSSQSESAIKSIKTNITNVASPVANTAKEILSPFSKFAKGVQTFGANLDPRKLKPGQTLSRNLSDQHLNERQKLIERWQGCRSALIAL